MFVKTTLAERVNLDGKKVIVTGASPGSLGFETARVLASWGANVVFTTRKDPEATENALAEAAGADAAYHVVGRRGHRYRLAGNVQSPVEAEAVDVGEAGGYGVGGKVSYI